MQNEKEKFKENPSPLPLLTKAGIKGRFNVFCMLTPLEASHYEAVPSLRSSDVFVGASF